MFEKINDNGVISFEGAQTEYTPPNFPTGGADCAAPYWSDNLLTANGATTYYRQVNGKMKFIFFLFYNIYFTVYVHQVLLICVKANVTFVCIELATRVGPYIFRRNPFGVSRCWDRLGPMFVRSFVRSTRNQLPEYLENRLT